jgi:hypothetical protein
MTVRVMTAWNCNQGPCNTRKKIFNDFIDSVIGDIYVNDGHDNVQTAVGTPHKVHFATSFNQFYGHSRNL